MLFIANARTCVPLMSRYCFTEKIFVSACRCFVGVVCVLPVIILSALFCIIYKLFSCVLDKTGVQAGILKSITECVWYL